MGWGGQSLQRPLPPQRTGPGPQGKALFPPPGPAALLPKPPWPLPTHPLHFFGEPARAPTPLPSPPGAEPADPADGDGDRRAPGEQAAFQEVVGRGHRHPHRGRRTRRGPPPAAASRPPRNPLRRGRRQGAPAPERVPASSSDAHEQSHILPQWGSRGKVVRRPPRCAPRGPLANPGHEPPGRPLSAPWFRSLLFFP